MMDEKTVRQYNQGAKQSAARYETADMDGLHRRLLRVVRPGQRVLDIGCGSGRELARLAAAGATVVGIDPAKEMIEAARQLHPELKDSLIIGTLPSLPAQLAGDSFDVVLLIAVLMHLPDSQLKAGAEEIRELLKAGGSLFLSVPHRRRGLDKNERDSRGRLFRQRPPRELQSLFERLGFRLEEKWEEKDGLGRRGMVWVSLHLQKSEPRP